MDVESSIEELQQCNANDSVASTSGCKLNDFSLGWAWLQYIELETSAKTGSAVLERSNFIMLTGS